jgi:hypothetical protein
LTARNEAVFGALGRHIQERLGQAPELLEPIHDLALLARHRALLDALMAAVFAPATWEQDYAAALVPFRMQSFYATPAFARALSGPDGVLHGRINADESTPQSKASANEIVPPDLRSSWPSTTPSC